MPKPQSSSTRVVVVSSWDSISSELPSLPLPRKAKRIMAAPSSAGTGQDGRVASRSCAGSVQLLVEQRQDALADFAVFRLAGVVEHRHQRAAARALERHPILLGGL